MMRIPRLVQPIELHIVSVPAEARAHYGELLVEARARAHYIISRLDSPVASAGIAALAYLFFMALRLYAHAGDFSTFVHAGSRFVNPSLAPSGLHVLRHSPGYDGQYYYALALNPFTSKGRFDGLWIDNPPYRQQRILYPLLVWVLSLGHATLVPAMLVLVNAIALVAMGWVGALYASSLGRHAMWGLMLVFYPGFVLSIARDLPEALAALLVVASLFLLKRNKAVWATVCLTLAILTRETSALLAFGAAAVWAAGWCARAAIRVGAVDGTAPQLGAGACRQMPARLQRLLRACATARMPWHYAAIPLAALALWQWVLLLRWHRLPVLAGEGNIAAPLAGVVGRIERLAPFVADAFQRVTTLEIVLIAGFTWVVVAALWRSREGGAVKVAWIMSLALAAIAAPVVWGEDWSFLRALTEFFALGSLIVLADARWYRWAVLAGTIGLWCLLALTRFA